MRKPLTPLLLSVYLTTKHPYNACACTADPTQRAPGADDNGSGSSAMLEIARVLADNDVEFEYTYVGTCEV